MTLVHDEYGLHFQFEQHLELALYCDTDHTVYFNQNWYGRAFLKTTWHCEHLVEGRERQMPYFDFEKTMVLVGS